MEIEEIKNLWQQQIAKDTEIKTSGYYSGLMDELKKNETKTRRKYIWMGIVMVLTMFFIDKTAIEPMPNKTILTWLGFGMIYFAMVCIVIVSWATVFNFKINNITQASLDFLRLAREKLGQRNKIRTVGMPLYLITLVTGLSLSYIQITERMETGYRLLTYSLMYIFVAVITFYSLKREKKKYLKNVKPIEDKIDSLLSE